MLKKGEQATWQHRYWKHQIRDETDFARHVKAGVYASDWESDSMCLEGIGHE
jgi:putative transposase